MRLVLLGPPGVGGKGTQASNIVKKIQYSTYFNWRYI